MTHEGQVFSMEQCTNLYFHCIEVINDLIESLQMYSMQTLNQLQSQQLKSDLDSQNQAAYYENIIKNIDIVLQLGQVACIYGSLPHVPSPRDVPSQVELENDNIGLMLQAACGDEDILDKGQRDADHIHGI